jgi:hypothetical protein
VKNKDQKKDGPQRRLIACGAESIQNTGQRAAPFINEPRPDWVPLLIAPLYCFSDGNMQTGETWETALAEEAKKSAKNAASIPSPSKPLNAAPWSVESTTKSVCIKRDNVTTEIQRHGRITIRWWPTDAPSGARYSPTRFWRIDGSGDMILNHRAWQDGEIPESEDRAATWHKVMLRLLLGTLSRNFSDALQSGSAHLFARKNSTLAPFERVAYDQMYYFELFDGFPKGDKDLPWHHPWSSNDCFDYFHYKQPVSARSPSGELLHSIYAAPGKRIKRVHSRPDQECLDWLRGLFDSHPDERPMKLEDLAQKACSMFPGLAKTHFYECLRHVQKDTGNFSWSEGGRPKNPLTNPPYNK